MSTTNITINLHFNEITRRHDDTRPTFPLSGDTTILDVDMASYYRDSGYTAEIDGNLITITTTYGNRWEYVVTFDIEGHNPFTHRSSEDNIRFWRLVDHIVDARLQRIIKYINRKTW